jgi:hypothetical protein
VLTFLTIFCSSIRKALMILQVQRMRFVSIDLTHMHSSTR